MPNRRLSAPTANPKAKIKSKKSTPVAVRFLPATGVFIFKKLIQNETKNKFRGCRICDSPSDH